MSTPVVVALACVAVFALLSASVFRFSQDTGLFMFQEIHKSNLYPAGMDWDEKHQRFIIGSLGESALFMLSPGQDLETFVTDPDIVSRNITYLGVKVDQPRNRVLAVGTSLRSKIQARQRDELEPLPSFEALVGYDLDTGSRVLFARLDQVVSNSSQIAQASSIAVDAEGNAYVTNPVESCIWKVTPAGVATLLTEDEQLKPQGYQKPAPHDVTTWGLNGILYDTNAQDLKVLESTSGSGRLFRVDVHSSAVEFNVNHTFDEKKLGGLSALGHCEDCGSNAVVFLGTDSAARHSPSNTDYRMQWIRFPSSSSSCFPMSIAMRRGMGYFACSHLPDLLQGKSRDSFSIRYLRFANDLAWSRNDMLLFSLCWIIWVVATPLVMVGLVFLIAFLFLLIGWLIVIISLVLSRVGNYHQINHL